VGYLSGTTRFPIPSTISINELMGEINALVPKSQPILKTRFALWRSKKLEGIGWISL